MTHPLLRASDDGPLLCDGAMGTELQRAGLEPGGCGEAWNVDRPADVLAIQRAYVDAGVDCLITNTFGGSGIMLERHGELARVRGINQAAVEIAREAFGERGGFVFGGIGPFGGVMEPFGDIPASAVEEAFGVQAEALCSAGVDAILIETQTSLEELTIGISAARAAGAEVVIGSLAFDALLEEGGFATMMGVDPERAAEFLVEQGVEVMALNCGTGVDMASAVEIVQAYREVDGRPIMAQPNAGQPELENLKTVYRQTPEAMARGVEGLIGAGALIVGGCCGSTPEHIRAMRTVLG